MGNNMVLVMARGHVEPKYGLIGLKGLEGDPTLFFMGTFDIL